MLNLLTYKGYTADIRVDIESKILCGQVLDIKDLVTFEGKTVEEAEREFHKSVDAYLEFCKELGQEPNKPFSGKLPFRTTPETHRQVFLAAVQAGKSINAWMEEILSEAAEQALSGKTAQKPAISPEERRQIQKQLLDRLRSEAFQLWNRVKPLLKNHEGDTFDQFMVEVGVFLKSVEQNNLESKDPTEASPKGQTQGILKPEHVNITQKPQFKN